MRPCNKPVWVQPRICEFCRSLVIQLATAQDNYRIGVVWSVQYVPRKFIAWDLPSQRKALPLRSFYGSKGWPYGQHGYGLIQ